MICYFHDCIIGRYIFLYFHMNPWIWQKRLYSTCSEHFLYALCFICHLSWTELDYVRHYCINIMWSHYPFCTFAGSFLNLGWLIEVSMCWLIRSVVVSRKASLHDQVVQINLWNCWCFSHTDWNKFTWTCTLCIVRPQYVVMRWLVSILLVSRQKSKFVNQKMNIA